MKATLARCTMAIAVRCLGSNHRQHWGSAMAAEFEIAVDAEEALSFAIGCLSTALGDMPKHEEGRFALASHILALGVMLPIAALLVSSVPRGFAFLAPSTESAAVLLGSGYPSFGINEANQVGLPLMALLTLALGFGHLALAWAILERDWKRVTAIGSMGAAVVVTLLVFSSILFFGDGCAIPQAAIIALELVAVWALVGWHAGLPNPVNLQGRFHNTAVAGQ